MRKSELEHVIRAAKEITGETEFVVIGSQALHGAFPNLVDKLVTSYECDISITDAPEKTELLKTYARSKCANDLLPVASKDVIRSHPGKRVC